jgi:hypothetical protein
MIFTILIVFIIDNFDDIPLKFETLNRKMKIAWVFLHLL